MHLFNVSEAQFNFLRQKSANLNKFKFQSLAISECLFATKHNAATAQQKRRTFLQSVPSPFLHNLIKDGNWTSLLGHSVLCGRRGSLSLV